MHQEGLMFVMMIKLKSGNLGPQFLLGTRGNLGWQQNNTSSQ